ncbi:MAG TPA: type II and III secretion system protein family protein [Phycisphaerae bacterium]|nr:type II and III secretion system protein family protein [Phycisphaerae bacterium]HNU43772.1 type II and III secretion system protein family protein [Phycisphaerae bacterium]
MTRQVKEDSAMVPCRQTRRGLLLGLVAVGVLAGGVVIPAVAQPAAASGAPPFVTSVKAVSGEHQRVQVPLNRSVIVQTSVEISQVNVIADEVADVQAVSPRELLVTGKSYGLTSILLWGAGGQQYTLEVAVELDLEALNEALRVVDPQSDVQARSVLGNVLLTGTVSGAERAQRMVEIARLFAPRSGSGKPLTIQNQMDVAGEQQVLLRCVVAEVNRTAVRQLGVNGFLAGQNVRDMFLINQLGGINPSSIGAAGGTPVTQKIPFLTGEDGIFNSSAPTLTLGFPRVQMELFIQALSDNGLLQVLAEPNLVAISGETASFLAGGEFPIPVPQGNQQVTIEFRQFGVRLNFTPVVRAQQAIRLRVAPEVSELDYSTGVQIEGYVVPGLRSRSAETTIEMGSGQTLAIAGLLSEQVRGLSSRVPGLGELPVLGALFRSVEFRRSLTELVIFVTPEVVAPLDPQQVVPVPGEDVAPPTPMQLYALGWLEDPRGREPARPGAAKDAAERAVLESEPSNLSVHGPWGHTTGEDRQQ